ncbi:hypothetical protein CRE_19936 [Caenorhabditis remanei]|uniref:Tc3 transposase DNA binding domain-containing protein n=1 Tax=Caenorhabditis remanei TaxID=31234 RepID=E3N8D8_CAERE|nr:hypothetical protein CRE_19936 [Caenorhabditis remanei]
MGRGKPLTDFEKGQIAAKYDQGLSNRQIARDLGRSLDAINRYIKDPLNHGTKKFPGRPSLLTIVFSDEKKFNCDGLDGYNSYWHDLRKEKLRFSRRNFNGGGCMVWAAISSAGRVKFCFVSKRMDGSEYRYVLRRSLLPFWRRNRHKSYQFMQDVSPSSYDNEVAGGSKNPCFGLTSLLSGLEYYRKSWHAVDQNLLDNLYLSLDNRLYELTVNSGGHINY